MKRAISPLFAAAVVLAVYSCGGGDNGVVPVPNRAPVAVGTIPGQTLPATDTMIVDVRSYFNDPDGDALTYSAATSDAGVVRASVSGSSVAVVAEAKGTAAVTVTASDPGGLTAIQSLDVTVVGKPGFLKVVLDYPEPDIGAVVLLVEGPSVDSVRAGQALTAYQAPVPAGRRVFLAGTVPLSGTVLLFWSEDVSEAHAYVASVEQAAGKDYGQRSVASATAAVIR